MNLRLRGMSLLAAVAMAGAGVVAAAPNALAASSTDTAKFCNVTDPNTMRKNCAIQISEKNVTEGGTVKAHFYGASGTTTNFQLFWISEGGDHIMPIGNPFPITTKAASAGTGVGTAMDQTITVPKLVAPQYGGLYRLMIQTADWKPGMDMIGSNASTKTNDPSEFHVYSARAYYSQPDFNDVRPGQKYQGSLSGGIDGHHFLMQVKVGNEWRTINSTPTTGTISGNRGSLEWVAPDLAKGTYPVRVINEKTGDVVWEGEYLAQGATSGSTAAPTKGAAPAKERQGGLAKTGL